MSTRTWINHMQVREENKRKKRYIFSKKFPVEKQKFNHILSTYKVYRYSQHTIFL